jgi:transposase-like protein
VGARTIGDYPRSLAEFQRRFSTQEACVRYLVETRWPDGFRCLWCGSANARLMTTRRVWQCRDCRRQTRLTAGTVLERTHLALPTWFAAAYLMSSVKPGISALQLSRQLGISLKTAWLLLHKLRRAMVDPARGKLRGAVEVDETWIGGRQAGLKGGRQRKDRKALLVVLAVERRRKEPRADGKPHAQPIYLGRLRAEIVPDASQATLTAFLERTVEPGSTIISDAWQGYAALSPSFAHQSVNQSALKRAGFEPNAVPGVHRVIGNLKTWLLGTYHGVGADHLDRYLDEFVFRFNRRFSPMAGFATLLRLGSELPPTPRALISPSLQPGATARHRGRSTGLTSARFSHQIGESASLEEAIAKLTAELPA